MSINDAIKVRMQQLGIGPAEMGRRLNISTAAVSQWTTKNRKYMPMAKRHHDIASALGMTLSELLALDPEISSSSATNNPLSIASDNHEVRYAPNFQFPTSATLSRDLPVYGSAECGPHGQFELNGSSALLAVDWVRRPAVLAGVKDAFAVYAHGDSMSPWRESGETVFVNPTRPPRVGDYVVIIIRATDPNIPRKAFIKRLKARESGELVVEQFNPRQDMRFALDGVDKLWRVVPWEEAFGLRG